MKLDQWLKRNFMTTAMFAEQLSEAIGKDVSARTVESWRQGVSMPRYHVLKHIAKVTDGQVKPRDLIVRREQA